MEAETELGMAQCHRQHIEDNIEQLIEHTKYDPLVSKSVDWGLITQAMRSIIEKRDSENHNMTKSEILHNRHLKYFQKITKRGPHAFNTLKEILGELKYFSALNILKKVDQRNDSDEFISLTSQNRNRNSINNAGSFNNNLNVACSFRGGSFDNNSPQSPDSVDKPVFPNGADEPLVPYDGTNVKGTRNVIKSKSFQIDNPVGTYCMQSKTDRGVVLIVNIIDFNSNSPRRNGGPVDSASLIHIFHEFGFKIFNHMNLNQNKFFRVLKDLIASKYVEDTECFVLVLMTHGERVGEIDKVQFSDGSFCNVAEITNLFQSQYASNLIHKPKVLIFPFCRGRKADNGYHPRRISDQKDYVQKSIETDSVGTQPNELKNVSTLSDMLICYATPEGYSTMRDPVEGSWYIKYLCDVMAEHAHNTSMEDILKLTDMRIRNLRTEEGNLQTGNFINLGFYKKLFFNPGFPLE